MSLDNKIQKAKEERNDLIDKAEAILDKDNPSDKELARVDNIQNSIDEKDAYIEKLKAKAQRRAANAVPYDSDEDFSKTGNDDVQIWESVSGRDKGRPIKVLSNRASLKNTRNLDSGNMNWRDYLRARISGYAQNNSLTGYDDPGSGYQNVLSTTSDTSLVPEPLSADIIDLARSKARVMQAGAQTVPMDSKTLTIARITGDPQTAWKAENSSHSASDVTTEPLTFSAKTLIASVKMSVELSEDSPNASSVIEDSLSNSLALELDRVALVGSGSGAEPQGLYNASGVQTESMGTNGGAISDYTPFSNAYQKVLEANGQPNAVIYAPRTWGDVDRLVDSTGQPLQPPQSYQDLETYQTTQVPIDQTQGTGTDLSTAFVGEFPQLLFGVRTDLRIEISRVASDGTNSAWEDLQVWVRAYLRADVQLAHPDHFCNITGISS